MIEEQIDLFQSAYEEYKTAIEEQKTDYKEFVDCPKCHVKPVAAFISKHEGGVSPHWYITCPICGYSCATIYDRYEHWNTLNKYRVRDGKL